MRLYNDHGSWWGHHGPFDRPGAMSIIDIIADGSMTTDLAALLWLILEAGGSIIVSSPPRLAGKTTTLSALLDFLPEPTTAYFSSGRTEQFDVPPLDNGVATYLMLNEISDHLPIYTWGAPALRALGLLERGYALAATMHAADARQTTALLERELGAPVRQLALLDAILSLRLRTQGRREDRHVSELALVEPEGGGYRIETLAIRGPDDAALALRPDASALIARRLGREPSAVELSRAERRSMLDKLLADSPPDRERLRSALRAFGARPDGR